MKLELKSRQVCLFIIAFFPIVKIFTAPSVLSSFASNDLWISTLIILAVDFIGLLAIIYAYSHTKSDLFTLIENTLGKFWARAVFILYFIFFFLKAIVPLNEQKDYVELTLYTLMPSKFYFLPFFAVALYLCCKRLRVLGRAADVLWAFSVLGLIVLISLSIPNADYSALLPIGANGFNSIFKASYSALNWFCDLPYLMFFIGNFRLKKGDGIKIAISFLISVIMIVIFMITFYSVFTSIAYRQRFALTEISKYTAVINNIGRFDYLGIVLILVSNIFALSLPLFFACKILDKIFNITKKWISPIVVVGTQLVILLVFTRNFASIENFMKTYASAFFFIVGNILPLFLLALVKKEKKYAKNV